PGALKPIAMQKTQGPSHRRQGAQRLAKLSSLTHQRTALLGLQAGHVYHRQRLGFTSHVAAELEAEVAAIGAIVVYSTSVGIEVAWHHDQVAHAHLGEPTMQPKPSWAGFVAAVNNLGQIQLLLGKGHEVPWREALRWLQGQIAQLARDFELGRVNVDG